jgi:hypothetical protein
MDTLGDVGVPTVVELDSCESLYCSLKCGFGINRVRDAEALSSDMNPSSTLLRGTPPIVVVDEVMFRRTGCGVAAKGAGSINTALLSYRGRDNPFIFVVSRVLESHVPGFGV